jgi:hypothetical protein
MIGGTLKKVVRSSSSMWMQRANIGRLAGLEGTWVFPVGYNFD